MTNQPAAASERFKRHTYSGAVLQENNFKSYSETAQEGEWKSQAKMISGCLCSEKDCVTVL